MAERTCVVCRETAEKEQLIRFCETEAGVIADASGSHSGRGAYCHLKCIEPGCVENAKLARQLFGSFRRGSRNANTLRQAQGGKRESSQPNWVNEFDVKKLLDEMKRPAVRKA